MTNKRKMIRHYLQFKFKTVVRMRNHKFKCMRQVPIYNKKQNNI